MHELSQIRSHESQRLQVTVRGAVQGVGFRPFVYRLATELGLKGCVSNGPEGVFIEAEGPAEKLKFFLSRLELEKPPHSFIQSLESSFLDLKGYSSFVVLESGITGKKSVLVMPDIAVCEECLKEIFDPANRRYLYPFTNCTHCGPRYSIIEALPYDRERTTMREFTLCDACREEYEDPKNRRYHAQPNACPYCGPHLELWDGEGRVVVSHAKALRAATKLIQEGQVLAVKGLGGFHLCVDATSDAAVERLRTLKHREEKPFALMMPSVEEVREACELSELEERLLRSPEAPIVLLRRKRKETSRVASSVTFRNPNLGIMLPYTPLHHILLRELNFPMVATSGNLSEEPILTDEKEALKRLRGVANFFLVHNRRIARPVDDSIARIMAGRELVLRRARGFAPLPFHMSDEAPSILSLGAHLKNTVAQSVGHDVFVSQHIGDLETVETFNAFRDTAATFEKFYEQRPKIISCDLHPDYLSTKYAKDTGLPVIPIQHHYAHILSCMAENELEGTVLGVAWDGTGYGNDGTIWGGEFLRVDKENFTRFGHFANFRLPGSGRAVREGRRAAVGLLYEIFGDALFEMKEIFPIASFSPRDLTTLKVMLKRGINSPKTSSAGRLFDAVASILGLCHVCGFEGQTAMELEFTIENERTEEKYPMNFFKKEPFWIFDWKPMAREILDDLKNGISAAVISAKFHNTLVESLLRMSHLSGEKKIVLSGGCFQNKYLLERAVRLLSERGFSPYWHQRIPPNDGGISLGQTVAAMRHCKNAKAGLKERVLSCV